MQSQEKEIILAIPAKDYNQLNSCFFAEKESFQETLKGIAKAEGIEVLEVYTRKLFAQAFAERQEWANAKRVKVLKSAISILVATGKSEAEAKRMLGLGDED
jgi:hypothetical protein